MDLKLAGFTVTGAKFLMFTVFRGLGVGRLRSALCSWKLQEFSTVIVLAFVPQYTGSVELKCSDYGSGIGLLVGFAERVDTGMTRHDFSRRHTTLPTIFCVFICLFFQGFYMIYITLYECERSWLGT